MTDICHLQRSHSNLCRQFFNDGIDAHFAPATDRQEETLQERKSIPGFCHAEHARQ